LKLFLRPALVGGLSPFLDAHTNSTAVAHRLGIGGPLRVTSVRAGSDLSDALISRGRGPSWNAR